MRNIAAASIIPVFGWIFSSVIAVLTAIPLYFLWSWLGPTYFWFVPAAYLNMGFLHMAGMLVLIGFFKLILTSPAPIVKVRK